MTRVSLLLGTRLLQNPFVQHLYQRALVQGLSQVIIHTRTEEFFLVTRHKDIHENDVIVEILGCLHCIEAVTNDIGEITGRPQKVLNLSNQVSATCSPNC